MNKNKYKLILMTWVIHLIKKCEVDIFYDFQNAEMQKNKLKSIFFVITYNKFS